MPRERVSRYYGVCSLLPVAYPYCRLCSSQKAQPATSVVIECLQIYAVTSCVPLLLSFFVLVGVGSRICTRTKDFYHPPLRAFRLALLT